MEELREKVEKQYAAFPPKLRSKIKFSPTLNMYNDRDNVFGRLVGIAFEHPESPIGKGSLKDLVKSLQITNETELLRDLSNNMTRIQSEEGVVGGKKRKLNITKHLSRRGRNTNRKTLRQRK